MSAQNSDPAPRRVVGRPWQKGVSGNPGGRPKSERRYLIGKYGEDGAKLHQAMDRLLGDSKTPPQTKADLLKFKLERLGGRAPQTIDVPGLGDVAAALALKVVHELHPGPTAERADPSNQE